MSSSQQSTSTTGRFPAQRRLLIAVEKNGPDSSDARVPMNTHEKYGDFQKDTLVYQRVDAILQMRGRFLEVFFTNFPLLLSDH